MILIPILAREAVRAAKQVAIYRLRFGSVIVAFLGACFLLREGLWTSSAAIGRGIFDVLVWIAFVFCLLSGVFFSSGLLCQERREGSLALLFLTRLTGLDIVLGKITAIIFLTGQIVLGLVPVLALCIPLGGVSLAEFWRAAATLLATLSLSLATGLFISALNRELSRSILISFTVTLVVTAALAYVDTTLRESFHGMITGVIVPGLVPLMTSFHDLEYRAAPQGFLLSLSYQFLLAATLLLLAGRILKRLSIETAPAPSRLWQFIHSRSAMPREERRKLLQRNPMYWVTLRHRWRWLGTWTIFCLLIVLWFYTLEYFQFLEGARLLMIFAMAPLLHLLLKLAMAAESTGRFSSAQSGELELLLSTPLTSGQIVRGQQRGLTRQFIWPLITVLVVDLFFSFAYGRMNSQRDAASLAGYLLIYTLGITTLIDAPALVWVGLWQGLRCKKPLQALQRTILLVVLLPTIIYLFAFVIVLAPLMCVGEFLTYIGVGDLSAGGLIVLGFIILWLLVNYITNAILERKARTHLKTFLRFIAADPSLARAFLEGRVRRVGPHREFMLQTMPGRFAPL